MDTSTTTATGAGYILRLPEEILIAIFEIIVKDDESHIVRHRTALTLVSARFNAIIQNTPSLWTQIRRGQSDSMIALALARSQSVPLDLELYCPEHSVAGSFKAAYDHIRRWRKAKLILDSREPLLLLTTPAPLLEEIRIEIGGRLVAISVDLFGGEAPLLTSVILCGASIPWQSRILSGLKVLVLEDIGPSPPSLPNLVSMLTSSPQLSVLKLDGVRFDWAEAESYPIYLPELHTLFIATVPQRVANYLFQNIKASPSRQLVLDCNLQGAADPLSFIPLTGPFVSSLLSESSRIRLKAAAESVHYVLQDTPYNLELTLHHTPTSTLLEHLLSALPPALLALPTEVLITDYHEGHALLMAINATRVTKLDMQMPSDNLIQVLGNIGEGGEWFFPNLQQLILSLGYVEPGAFVGMVEARYGVGRAKMDLPVPFTSLEVFDAMPYHADERGVVEEIVGRVKVRWTSRRGKPEDITSKADTP